MHVRVWGQYMHFVNSNLQVKQVCVAYIAWLAAQQLLVSLKQLMVAWLVISVYLR